jgi:signal peptidase I
MLRRRLAPLLLVGLALAGCGGSSDEPKVEHVQVTTTYRVPSSAMEPTLHCARPAPGCLAVNPDEVVVRSYSGDPKRGHIIAFRTPPTAKLACGAGGIFIKRLVGLPRETVREKLIGGRGYVFVDGRRLEEPYVQRDRRDSRAGTWRVPAGRYFLMGDNRSQSCDSREWGTVPRANIIGRVVKIRRPG